MLNTNLPSIIRVGLSPVAQERARAGEILGLVGQAGARATMVVVRHTRGGVQRTRIGGNWQWMDAGNVGILGRGGSGWMILAAVGFGRMRSPMRMGLSPVAQVRARELEEDRSR
jgi:hypothetical protein